MPDNPIAVETTVNAPIEKVWQYWTEPEHVKQWNNASDDWHTTKASNDLREGGDFSFRMEAKDESAGFDFGGIYTKVLHHKQIKYAMGDGRKVSIEFNEHPSTSLPAGQAGSVQAQTHISETFDPESENPREMQQQGWQAIMDNFKKYAEALTLSKG